GMAELHDVLAVEPMHRRAEPLPQRDEIVAVNRRIVGDDASLHQHRDVGGNNGADAAGGEFAFPVDAGLRQRAVLVVESARDVRAEDADLERKVAEAEWRETHICAHGMTSAAGAALARFQTARNKAGTKAAAGHWAQLPSMNSMSRAGMRSRAAPRPRTTRVPARTAPEMVAPGITACR